MNSKTLILGGGLAGLSAAFHLKTDYELFERDHHAGGVARSFKKNGFTFDHAIHILYTKDPYASRLIRELLGENFVEQVRRSFIYSHDTYTHYPYQTNTHGLPKKIIQENILGFIEAQYANPTCAPKNFQEWMLQTFGEGIARNFMIPFNRKVWAVEPSSMGYQWIADRVILPSIDDVLDGAYNAPQLNCKGPGPNATFWYPGTGGTQALPDAFLKHLKLPTNAKSIAISEKRRVVKFESGIERHFDTLISTIPLPALVDQLECAPKSVREAASRLRSNSVITINLGIDREGISNAHWVYYPEESVVFQRLSFPMNFSESMGPRGTSSVMAEISTSDERPIDREGLMERVRSDLIAVQILRESDKILAAATCEITPAYIIYDDHHQACRDLIIDYLAEHAIFSCGRFGEWEYYNMDHAILSGKRAAEKVLNGERTRRSAEVGYA